MGTVDWRNDKHRIEIKNEIKAKFDKSIRGREPILISGERRHDGWIGHWLQRQFDLEADAANAPDLNGFELKDDTGTGVTTFGDWSADEYIFFSHNNCRFDSSKAAECKKCRNSVMDRTAFLQIFGVPNIEKGNRYSWSGKVCPKVNRINEYGQILVVYDDGSINAEYFFSEDQRPNKRSIVPSGLQVEDLVLAAWCVDSLKTKLENKFNELGWVKCIRESNGRGKYVGMNFGGPIRFEDWIDQVCLGNVYLDSGMYEGNNRKYSQWRAKNTFWESLTEERY